MPNPRKQKVQSEIRTHTLFSNQSSWGSFGVPMLLGLGLGIKTVRLKGWEKRQFGWVIYAYNYTNGLTTTLP